MNEAMDPLLKKVLKRCLEEYKAQVGEPSAPKRAKPLNFDIYEQLMPQKPVQEGNLENTKLQIRKTLRTQSYRFGRNLRRKLLESPKPRLHRNQYQVGPAALELHSQTPSNSPTDGRCLECLNLMVIATNSGQVLQARGMTQSMRLRMMASTRTTCEP